MLALTPISPFRPRRWSGAILPDDTAISFRILEAGYQLKVPRMFAALALISACGIAIFALLGALQHLLLRRWHESAMRAEG